MQLVRPEQAVEALASTQHGALARWQVRPLGVSDSAIAHRVRSGRWQVRGNGVYALASHPRTLFQRLMVAVLDAGPGAAACDRCAAALFGVDGFWLGSHGLEIVRPYGGGGRSRPGVVERRTRHLPAGHITVRNGIPTTTLPRTMCELAALLTGRELGRALDNVLLTRKTTIALIRAAADEIGGPGRKGFGALSAALVYRSPGAYVPPESELEARLLEVIVEAGLPLPILQAPPPWRSREVHRLDFTWPEATMILEGDSRTWHARVERLHRDARRTRLAATAGYLVVPATWEDVTHHRADLASELSAIYRRRIARSA